jgi:hypothetical protein
MNKTIRINSIGFLGSCVKPTIIEFKKNLTVICGASDTGKSFLVEVIDFLLGGNNLREIPELEGYEKARITIESSEKGIWTFERSILGGNYKLYQGDIQVLTNVQPNDTLKMKHAAGREDNISGWLLSALGLLSKNIRKNAHGDCRSLSFRDIARLVIVDEREVIRQDSPYLTGQYISKTSEKSTLKLMLTGVDDSAIVPLGVRTQEEKSDLAKAELIEQWISDLSDEISENGFEREDLNDQLNKLDLSILSTREKIHLVQSHFNEMTSRRRNIIQNREEIKDRIDDITNMKGRFNLLRQQYVSDLYRLMAIEESGSLFVHHDRVFCPECGAPPHAQQSIESCNENVESIIIAASAEMEKIKILASDLNSTITALNEEHLYNSQKLADIEEQIYLLEINMKNASAREIASVQSDYALLVDTRSKVLSYLSVFSRLDKLISQKENLFGNEGVSTIGNNKNLTYLPTKCLHEFSNTVERILEAWDFPDTGDVYFDEVTMDFVIKGKLRGNRGKGLRAITHAAVTLGLLEFCKERSLPHPGFVVIDSPLLAYYKPEGESDSLKGSALKKNFYRYLLEEHSDSQVIIVENEHPPELFEDQLGLTVFTKNPLHGRFGLFPPKQTSNQRA